MTKVTIGTKKIGNYKYLTATAPDNIRLSTILKAISDKYTWKQLETKGYIKEGSGVTMIQINIKSKVGTLPYGQVSRKMLADWYKMEKKPYRNTLGKMIE